MNNRCHCSLGQTDRARIARVYLLYNCYCCCCCLLFTQLNDLQNENNTSNVVIKALNLYVLKSNNLIHFKKKIVHLHSTNNKIYVILATFVPHYMYNMGGKKKN